MKIEIWHWIGNDAQNQKLTLVDLPVVPRVGEMVHDDASHLRLVITSVKYAVDPEGQFTGRILLEAQRLTSNA